MEANSAVSRADGITDTELAALADPASSQLFTERERATLAYAEAMTCTNTVPEQVFEGVRQYFTEEEIVELTATIAWEICAAKFNRALEIEAQGVCAIARSSPNQE